MTEQKCLMIKLDSLPAGQTPHPILQVPLGQYLSAPTQDCFQRPLGSETHLHRNYCHSGMTVATYGDGAGLQASVEGAHNALCCSVYVAISATSLYSEAQRAEGTSCCGLLSSPLRSPWSLSAFSLKGAHWLR